MDTGNDLSGIVHTIKELEESRNEFLCENHELHDTIIDLEAELEELENIHRDNQTKIDEYEGILQGLQREHKTLLSAVSTKDMEIAELRGVHREMEDMKRHNENLFRDLNACQNKMCKLKDYIAQLEETCQEKEQCVARNEQQLQQLQHKITDLKRTVDCLAEENAQLARRYEDCKKTLEDAIMENDRFNEKLRMCEMARQKIEDCVNKNQSYIKQLKNELAKEQQNNAKLEQKLKALEEELAKYKREIAQLKEEIMGLNEEVDDKHSELEECHAELKRKIDEFENYKNTITSLKQKIMNNRDKNVGCSNMFGESRSRTHGSKNKQKCGPQRDEKPLSRSPNRNPCKQNIKKPRISKKSFKTKKNC
uniref:Uncharacterized protein n=1 Tax=Cacopsylla melanoneura TaxID=428564 RepID=A0A8D9FI31_9HEMI